MLRFVGNGDQKKFTKNPRRFSMQNSQANTEKIFTIIFLESRQSKEMPEFFHKIEAGESTLNLENPTLLK